MAYLPIDILKGQGHVDRLQATIEEREALLGNRYAQIREKAWRQGVGSLSRRERRDAEVSEQSRCALPCRICVGSFLQQILLDPDYADSQSRYSDVCSWVCVVVVQIAAGP